MGRKKNVKNMTFKELQEERAIEWEKPGRYVKGKSQREIDLQNEIDCRKGESFRLYQEAYSLLDTDREKEIPKVLTPILKDPSNLMYNPANELIKLTQEV